ncbi:hypothetical protein F5B22DRAFT_621948 [Xylaria bambusicola]|uniref:uncharacterized protein n=1 Tax=Xylaria bambusicola TaxID=326684 RepID=UPI0020080F0B|nr:uncharacterized protein F5B22DRAFT_621948 [Xylaria bambusicola]KAI0506938.1 hypothetical protein F5B22DRAFT_621948 [Xylaria bambusicola]
MLMLLLRSISTLCANCYPLPVSGFLRQDLRPLKTLSMQRLSARPLLHRRPVPAVKHASSQRNVTNDSAGSDDENDSRQEFEQYGFRSV